MRKIYFLLCTVLIACNSSNKEEKKDTLYLQRSSAETGISFTNNLVDTKDLNVIEYVNYYIGGGVAIGDINNDGLEDIFFSANQQPDVLYLNQGNFKFKDISQSSGIGQYNGWSSGVVMVDINGDDYLDIYVCRVSNFKGLTGHNMLYLNNGDNTFKEVSEEVGLNFAGFSTQATFLDYDRDGDLDMYLMNHSVNTVRHLQPMSSVREHFDPVSGDRFFENKLDEGQLKFEDVTKKVGIFSSPQGYGLGLVSTDINQDGWMDVYVGNDFHENDYLYINQQDGTFKESIEAYFGHTARFSMGVDVADINGDNLMDVFAADMLPEDNHIRMKSAGENSDYLIEATLRDGYDHQYARNVLQLNNQNKSFYEVGQLTDTYATDWSWAVLVQDYDNDGLSDIFVCNGIFKRTNDLDYINFLQNIFASQLKGPSADSLERELINRMPTLKIANYLYHNEGDLAFSNVSSSWGLDDPSYSNGAAYGDLDNDGDLDLVVNNINSEAFVYENRTDKVKDKHYLQVKLKGNEFNTHGVGAKVKVWYDGISQTKEVLVSRGFESSPSTRLNFGLGAYKKVDSLLVQWPDGALQKLKNFTADSLYILTENDTYQEEFYKHSPQNYTYLDFEHRENLYHDYNRERLIPEYLSTEGPAIAMADFNGDGMDDVFIGGAMYQQSSLILNSINGLANGTKKVFENSRNLEDVAAIALDVENDGDMDLYVVRGGHEYPADQVRYHDAIYLNDGKANFELADMNLPKTNGGCVSAADYDGDGDTDLFVGSRSIAGEYGLTPSSFILKNDNGVFSIAHQVDLGMVTAAQWYDYDKDGLKDLFVAGDWMPITYLKNTGEDFIDQTAQVGLSDTNGLWNSLEFGDINNDQIPDLIAGNLGLNSRLKAKVSEPISLYLDDFDGNGHFDPVIFYYNNGEPIPLESRKDLSSQLAYIKKHYLKFEKFAEVRTIEELTGKPHSEIAHIKHIYETRTTVFINNNQQFNKVPLPIEVQLSPVNQTLSRDVNNDGFTDLMYVGNFFGVTSPVGRYDACAGGLLLGKGDGQFEFAGFLPIPFDQEYRHILALDNNQFLAVPNSGKPVVFSLTPDTIQDSLVALSSLQQNK